MTWLSAAWAAFKGSKVAMIAVAVLTAIGIGLGILANERAKGRAQERARQTEKALEQAKERQDVEEELGGHTPGERRDRLRGWVPGAPAADERVRVDKADPAKR